MADPSGAKLFVNLGATEARRRLAGFGHGVRKIQSAGRRRALIIHTATGAHLTELEARFADVGCASEETELSEAIENLRNLGRASASWLRDAGLTTVAELRRIGPVLAYLRVKQRQPGVSLNLLWSLAAGLADRDWRDLSEEEKGRLAAEMQQVTAKGS